MTRALDGDATGYRRTLARCALRRAAAHPSTGGLALFRRRSPLFARLAQLEHAGSERPRLRRAVTAVVAAAMFACALPMVPTADRAVERIAETLDRPPGCLPLRYLVLKRLAEERSRLADSETPSLEEER